MTPIEIVKDEVFSKGIMSDIAFVLNGEVIFFPINELLSPCFQRGGFWIDTFETKGRNFLCKQRDKVNARETIINVNLQELSNIYDMTITLVGNISEWLTN